MNRGGFKVGISKCFSSAIDPAPRTLASLNFPKRIRMFLVE